jgi:hypothetical protein
LIEKDQHDWQRLFSQTHAIEELLDEPNPCDVDRLEDVATVLHFRFDPIQENPSLEVSAIEAGHLRRKELDADH